MSPPFNVTVPEKMHGLQKDAGFARLRMGSAHLRSKARFNGGTALQVRKYVLDAKRLMRLLVITRSIRLSAVRTVVKPYSLISASYA